MRYAIERKRATEAFRENLEKYRILVDNAQDAVFIVQNGCILFPNPSTLAILGYSATELAEMNFEAVIHPGDRNMVLERNHKRLLGEKVPTPYSFRVLNRAGQTLWVEINAVLITWEEAPAVLLCAREITPQIRFETRLHRTQKLETISSRVGSKVHDFNDLLSAIIGFTELELSAMGQGEEKRFSLEQVLLAGRRAKDQVKQILAFNRQNIPEQRSLKLEDTEKVTFNRLRARR